MAKDSLDVYTGTVNRMEPEIAMVDTGAALASIAISLKRIADSLEKLTGDAAVNQYGESWPDALQNGIERGLRGINTHDR